MLRRILLFLTLTTMATNAADRIFELRTYTAKEGRLDEVLARFRNHTVKLFEKHGMQNIGYWVPSEEPASRNTLIYIVAHKSRDAAAKSWDAFRKDPDWVKVKQESEKNGQIVDKVVSVFLNPSDFSRIK
ncbi:MAG: NIPSNAP family protein [Bryobacteraceae bacterium]